MNRQRNHDRTGLDRRSRGRLIEYLLGQHAFTLVATLFTFTSLLLLTFALLAILRGGI